MPECGPQGLPDEILERIDDVVFALDLKGCFTFVNAAAERSFHRSRQVLLGRPLARAFGEGVGKALEAKIREALSSQQPVRIDPEAATYGVDVEVDVYPGATGATVMFRDVAARRKAELALRESEERFHTLAEQIPQLTWISDRDGTVLWYNRRWLDYAGTSGETMQLRGWTTHLHPDHLERITSLISRSQESGESWEDTFTLRGRDGQYRWFLGIGLPIRDQHGLVVRWLSTATDVTERHWRAALAKGERRAFELLAQGTSLSTVLESLALTIEDVSQDGLLASILLLDETGKRLYHGAAPSLPNTYNQHVNGSSIGPAAGSCGTAAFRDTPVIVSEIATDPLWVDYRDIALEHGLKACWSTPFHASDGSILGTFAMYYREPRTPEPERLQLAELVGRTAATIIERACADHVRSRLTAIVDSSDDAIIGKSLEDVVTSWNSGAERLYGWSAQEMVGQPFVRIVPNDHLAEYQTVMSRVIHGERQPAFDTVRLHKDGSRLDVSASLSPILGEGGNIIGVSAITRDNSYRREVERLQREFLAMVTHELRSPITVIKGYGELMQRRKSYDERCVNAIVEQTGTMHRLVEDLLDASRIQVNHIELERERIDLVAAAHKSVAQTLAQATSHLIEVEAPDQPVEGYWDRMRVGQVLTNLLSNAVKYSGDGSRILVRVENHATCARVAVHDEGRGLEPDHLVRIFERFYRAEPSKFTGRSLGLGLYISKGLIEAHGGRIWAESEGLSHGSTFYFTLPCKSPLD